MVPKPDGVPLAAGANCEVFRHGEFTALVQEVETLVNGEAKMTPLSFKPKSGANALLSTMVNGNPLRQNQLLESVHPPKTRFGPQWNPECRNMSL
jgi:hypothetical protein